MTVRTAEQIYRTHHNHSSHVARVEEPAAIGRSWKWVTVLGNAAIGAAELVTGNLTTLSVTGDGVHNAGDTGGYYLQADNILNRTLTERQRARRRKIAHSIIAAGSLAVAVKAGVDVAGHTEAEPHRFAAYAAGASLLLNTYVWAKLCQGVRRKRALGYATANEHERDITKHLWAVDMPSAILAVGGVIAQKYNVHIEQTAAVATGLIGAWAFRPTQHNLEHHTCAHHHDVSESRVHHHEHQHGHKGEVSLVGRWRAQRQARRQADYDARWQRWLERCAASTRPDDYLAVWARRTLAGPAVTVA